MSETPEAESWETRTRSVRDAAMLLPFITLALLLPPIILVFSVPHYLAGIPTIVLYLYGVWAMAVLVSGLIARRLGAVERDGDHKSSGGR